MLYNLVSIEIVHWRTYYYFLLQIISEYVSLKRIYLFLGIMHYTYKKHVIGACIDEIIDMLKIKEQEMKSI